jgi:hypothetical protein
LGEKQKSRLAHFFKCVLSRTTENPLLRSRVVSVSYGSAWQILYDYRRFGDIKKADDLREESVSVRCTDWLGLLNEIRTFFQKNP